MTYAEHLPLKAVLNLCYNEK